MTDVLIKRELLERLTAYMRQRVCPAPSGKVATELHADLTAALAAPRQPEGEGLEVVAWLGGNGFHTEEKEATGAPFPLCHLSDAQRAIAELRDMLSGEVETNIQLRQKAFDLTKQRDKLAGLLDEVTDDFVVNYLDVDLIKRIDAALAEVNK